MSMSKQTWLQFMTMVYAGLTRMGGCPHCFGTGLIQHQYNAEVSDYQLCGCGRAETQVISELRVGSELDHFFLAQLMELKP